MSRCVHILLLVAALAPQVARGQDVAPVGEPYGLPVPAWAVEVSNAEFQALVASGRARLLGPTQRAADAAAQRARAAETSAVLADYLKRHKERAAELFGPVTARQSVGTPGGGYDVTFSGRSGEPYTYHAGGTEMARQTVARGLLDVPLPANQERIFRAIRQRLPVEWQQRVDRMGGGSFVNKNRWLANHWPEILRSLPSVDFHPPPSIIRQCEDEIGSGPDGGDFDRMSSPPDYSDNGVFAHLDWPNKDNLTCVRDQGHTRGTCGAFAIAGALETAVARRTRAESGGVAQFVNLSEQWIYGNYRALEFPDDFDEGKAMPDPELVYERMVLHGTVVPYEIGWEYNKSRDRQVFESLEAYTESCDGYDGLPVDAQGSWCSETTHQARLITTTAITAYGRETWAAYYLPEVPPGGARVSAVSVTLWSEQGREVGVGLAILMLRLGYPMHGGWRGMTSVHKTIVVPAGRGSWIEYPGYVPFPLENFVAIGEDDDRVMAIPGGGGGGDPDEKTDGGHNFQVAGFVSNAELRAAAAANPGYYPLYGDQGDYGERGQDLGGWFIVKNSWGRDAGDRGFYYVPVGWAYRNFGTAIAILGAEEVGPSGQ